MNPRIWATSRDGLISYVSLTRNKLKKVVEVMRNHFFIHEDVSVAVGLSENPQAIRELDELIVSAAMDGLSLIAVEKNTEKIVGCLITKLNVKEDQPKGIFKTINCKHSSARAFLEANSQMDNAVNAFDLLQTDCYLENMFVVTLPEFQGRGVARKLQESSFEVMQHLVNGENVKVALNGIHLPINPIPNIIFCLALTPGTKILTEKSGYVHVQVTKIDFRAYGLKNNLLLTSVISKIPFIWGVCKYLKKY